MCCCSLQADPNHMVSIGYEGFFGASSPNNAANPSGDWAEATGHDFERNFALPSLDFTEMHM